MAHGPGGLRGPGGLLRFRGRWVAPALLVLLVAALGAGGAAALRWAEPAGTTTTGTLRALPPTGSQAAGTAYLLEQAIGSPGVLRSAADALGLSPRALDDSISTGRTDGDPTLTITYSGPRTASEAQRVVRQTLAEATRAVYSGSAASAAARVVAANSTAEAAAARLTDLRRVAATTPDQLAAAVLVERDADAAVRRAAASRTAVAARETRATAGGFVRFRSAGPARPTPGRAAAVGAALGVVLGLVLVGSRWLAAPHPGQSGRPRPPAPSGASSRRGRVRDPSRGRLGGPSRGRA